MAMFILIIVQQWENISCPPTPPQFTLEVNLDYKNSHAVGKHVLPFVYIRKLIWNA
jgi:hypothetical protein